MSEHHTVGAEILDTRVPENYKDEINNIYELSITNREAALKKLVTLISKIETKQIINSEYYDKGIFSSELSNFDKRYIPDYSKLEEICNSMKYLGHSIVLTSGSFDILHIGHAQYLEKASLFGDLLVVGVDSDEKIKKKKGTDRPIVDENERLNMLTHLKAVDILTLKKSTDEKWELIKVVRPNTLIATEGTYTDENIKELENNYVDRVVVLPPQSTTSTTARLRKINIGAFEEVEKQIKISIDNIENIEDGFKEIIHNIAIMAIKSARSEKYE